MRILTNDYNDCELLNLATNKNGQGPYVIRQDGVPPGELKLARRSLFTPKDGTWVLNITAFTPRKEQQFIFQNAAELYATVQELGGETRSGGCIASGKKSGRT
jgi:hypothetical protein